MRILGKALLAILGTSICSTPVAAAPLPPTGPWVVDYSNDQCFLDRNYGTDARPVVLAIRRVPMDPQVNLGVYSRSGGPTSLTGKARLSFGPAAPLEASFRAYSVPGKDVRNFTTYLDNGAALLVAAAQSGSISLRAPGEVNETFLVPDLAQGMHALDACLADLAQNWGMSADQFARVRVPPRPLRLDYLTARDFSAVELSRNSDSHPQVRLWVDETGKPLDCVPLQATASPAFAATTCQLLLQRAAFSPALDANGKPIRSIAVYTADWVAD